LVVEGVASGGVFGEVAAQVVRRDSINWLVRKQRAEPLRDATFGGLNLASVALGDRIEGGHGCTLRSSRDVPRSVSWTRL
jgi:hypothetical protein